MYNPQDLNICSTQDAEIAALRPFYAEEFPLSEVDTLALEDEPLRVRIPLSDTMEVTAWLSNPAVWLAFHPRVDSEGRLVLD